MPVVVIDAPPGISHEAKKRMLDKVSAAVDEGYDGIVEGGAEILVFLRESSLENVAVRTRDYAGLQSENPKFLEAIRKRRSA